ncbi:MAG: hypothetical protein GY716_13090 [bacterium]|nr:hypothetical protein [bacterium]
MDENAANLYARYVLRVLARARGLCIVSLPTDLFNDLDEHADDRAPMFELEAFSPDTGELWRARADSLYEAAEALAEQLGQPVG